MTTTDERVERYLHARSARIDLPHAGIEAITRRARRHRRRRAATGLGVAAAVLVGVAAVAIGATGSGTGAPDRPAERAEGPVPADTPTTEVPMPLDWTEVTPPDGPLWGSPLVGDGGAVYSLTTAATTAPGDPSGEPRQVRRSEDGTTWEGVTLPEGFHASDIAAGDGRLLVVGATGALEEAGTVELLTSEDGGASWAATDLPIAAGPGVDGFPGRVSVVDAEVEVLGGTVVVAVSSVGLVDPAAVLPAGTAGAWRQEAGGLRADDGEALSWVDLGLPEDQVAVAEGRTRLLAGTDGGSPEVVHTVPGVNRTEIRRTALQAVDDGFWFLLPRFGPGGIDGAGSEPVSDGSVWHAAPDAAAWTEVPFGASKALQDIGVLDGRFTVVTAGGEIHVFAPDGSVRSTSVATALGLPSGTWVEWFGIGPLGLAAVAQHGETFYDDEREVVYTPDGISFSRTPIPPLGEGATEIVWGISVTADAVKVRLDRVDPDDPDGDEALSRRLFVGTPR